MTAGAGRFLSAVLAVASFGLPVSVRAASVADCSSLGGQTVKVTAVEPRLELRLADGRVLRLVGVDAATATPDDTAFEETTRARLASLVAGRDVSVRILDPKPDRWGRLAVFAFLDGAAGTSMTGGLAATAIAAGLARYRPEPAAHACRETFIAAETQARSAALGLWKDPFYAVLAVDERTMFDKRSATVVLAEGRLTAVDAGPYRTKLRFAARDRTSRDVLAATVLPRTMKLFETQGVTLSTLIGRTLRFRGLLDLRFGPEIELTGPDAVEVLPTQPAQPAPPALEAVGHG